MGDLMVYREMRRGVTRLVGGKLGTQTTALDAWPIGSVYMQYTSADPATLFGGTWIRFAKGKMPISLDEADIDFDTPGETGGLKSKALTANQITPHTHAPGTYVTGSGGGHDHGPGTFVFTRKAAAGTQAGASSGNTTAATDGQITGRSGTAADHSHGVQGESGDGSTAGGLGNAVVDRMPPYVAVYMWRRTA